MIKFKVRQTRMETFALEERRQSVYISCPFSALWKCLVINVTEGLRKVPEMKVCSSVAACNSTVLVLNQNMLERHFFFKMWLIRAMNWSPSCLTSASPSVEFGDGPVYSQVQSPSVANAHLGVWPRNPELHTLGVDPQLDLPIIGRKFEMWLMSSTQARIWSWTLLLIGSVMVMITRLRVHCLECTVKIKLLSTLNVLTGHCICSK